MVDSDQYGRYLYNICIVNWCDFFQGREYEKQIIERTINQEKGLSSDSLPLDKKSISTYRP